MLKKPVSGLSPEYKLQIAHLYEELVNIAIPSVKEAQFVTDENLIKEPFKTLERIFAQHNLTGPKLNLFLQIFDN